MHNSKSNGQKITNISKGTKNAEKIKANKNINKNGTTIGKSAHTGRPNPTNKAKS